MQDLQKHILELLGIQFKNPLLLQQAFTHRSYINENVSVQTGHNERLEFLGDAVLELAVTDYLYRTFPDTPEGQLTAFRSALVRTESISDVALSLSFNDFLLLSRGEARDMGKARSYILANTFESFVGAVYLDQGYTVAADFISQHLLPNIFDILKHNLWRDAKSYVQEKAQELLGVTPTYELVSQDGPDHDRTFVVSINFGDEMITTGTGTSKQEAQQSAARSALEIKEWN